MSIFLLIVGILLFIGLILVHEWGHFIAARRGGVDVEEYGVFFPPRVFKKRMPGGWLFSINAIPLGGFVKLKGETDTDTEPGTFGAASTWTKTKIMAAGVVMNLVTAYAILLILAVVGMPKLLDNQFTVASDTKVIAQAQQEVILAAVNEGSPAAQAGLKANDTLVSLTGVDGKAQSLDEATDLQRATKQNAGQTVQVAYERDGIVRNTMVTLRAEGPGYLGVGVNELRSSPEMRRSTWSAPVVAGGLIGQFTQLTFQGLGKALSGLGQLIAGTVTGNTVARQNGQAQASEQVSGPIGIVVILRYVSEMNYQFMLMIVALISLTLAIMNILPIPALDGGRLWLTLASRAMGKPLTQKAEGIINLTGFMILILLSIVIAVVDIRRFF